MQTPVVAVKMKVVRSIAALNHLKGLEATLEELTAIVREDMRRELTPEERSNYYGITNLGYPHKLFTKLSNVRTTEELVIAEVTGAFYNPSDHPDECYLFAHGKGSVAMMAPKIFLQINQNYGKSTSAKTFDELHDEFKSLDIEQKDWNDELQEIAKEYVKWACDDNPRLKGRTDSDS